MAHNALCMTTRRQEIESIILPLQHNMTYTLHTAKLNGHLANNCKCLLKVFVHIYKVKQTSEKILIPQSQYL